MTEHHTSFEPVGSYVPVCSCGFRGDAMSSAVAAVAAANAHARAQGAQPLPPPDEVYDGPWQVGSRAEYTDESLPGYVHQTFKEGGVNKVVFVPDRPTPPVVTPVICSDDHLIPASPSEAYSYPACHLGMLPGVVCSRGGIGCPDLHEDGYWEREVYRGLRWARARTRVLRGGHYWVILNGKHCCSWCLLPYRWRFGRCPNNPWALSVKETELEARLPDEYAVKAAADAAVRVVLEALYEEANAGGNLDDGLWCKRFRALLQELPDPPVSQSACQADDEAPDA